ncbi:MAG: hypothetical protein H0V51_24375, partial [Chloroflexi bacterium]|nr:hypothetical protein [Chloroflexota bacterium]
MGALALLAAGALSHGAVFLVPDPTWACAAALLLTVAVPGALLAMLVVPTEGTEPSEWLLTALGLGLTTLVAGGLILAYLPVRLGPTALLAWFDGLTVLLAAGILRFRQDWRLPRPTARAALPDLALIIGLGAVLRLPNLGYSE